MTDYQDLAEQYIAVWNEKDAASRQGKLTELLSSDVAYSDPMAQVVGREQFDAAIAAVQEQFPDFGFELVGNVDGHNDQMRFTWQLGKAGDSDAPVVGFDVATVDEQGQIDRVLGFLDKVPNQ